ncbi:MAG: sulfotransferase [Cytophagales bacterium]|nr:sulfotransferase [Cytophagales bacterium]
MLGVSLFANNKIRTGDTIDKEFTKTITSTAYDVLYSGNTVEGIDKFKKAVWKYYKSHRGEKKWGWKFPETYLIPELIHTTFPKARFIHILRDGRDLAFKSHLTDNPNKKLGKLILERTGTLGSPSHIQAASSWLFK